MMDIMQSSNGHNPVSAGQIKTWEQVLIRLLTMIVDRLPKDFDLNDIVEMRSLLKALQVMDEEGMK